MRGVVGCGCAFRSGGGWVGLFDSPTAAVFFGVSLLPIDAVAAAVFGVFPLTV